MPFAIDLLEWVPPVDVVKPWRPRVLKRDEWATRDYKGVYAWRMKQLALLRSNPVMLMGAKAYYADHPTEFIMDWMDTYDPRIKNGPKWIPFVLFERQAEFIQFLEELVKDGESGLVEKCRDMGVTWLGCAWSVHHWLFLKDVAIGWGSRREDLVDEIGIVDSIFEKMRMLLRRIPDVFLPPGFQWKDHATFMRLLNPANGSTVSGESGDNIGRGGRKTAYVKDESAHYERPEKIEAALGDNTDVQIDISSVNGLNNPFHKRRKAGIMWSPGEKIEPGKTRVFVMDWRDHPEKTQAWHDQRKAKWESEGLGHIFAQEVERNYSASISNTVIPLEWLMACVDAHLIERLGIPQDGLWGGALDPADGGLDVSAAIQTQGVILRTAETWGTPDVGKTTRRALLIFEKHPGIEVQYDVIGIGTNIKSEYNRLTKDIDPQTNEPYFDKKKVVMVPWNAGSGVQRPFDRVIENDDLSPMNRDLFGNFKAQAWWNMRSRVLRTWQAVTQSIRHDPATLISFDSASLGAILSAILEELAQVTSDRNNSTMKIIIDKAPKASDGSATKSPNLADCIVMRYSPAEPENATAAFGTYGD